MVQVQVELRLGATPICAITTPEYNLGNKLSNGTTQRGPASDLLWKLLYD